jgi:hypothetical protein
MSQSFNHELSERPLFRFAIQTDRHLEDAIDAWLAGDGIDEEREHVLSWMREDLKQEAQ